MRHILFPGHEDERRMPFYSPFGKGEPRGIWLCSGVVFFLAGTLLSGPTSRMSAKNLPWPRFSKEG